MMENLGKNIKVFIVIVAVVFLLMGYFIAKL